MKVFDLKYLEQINLFLNLNNDDKFIIIYLVKILDKPLINYKIKNKNNIIYENNKKIEFNMSGILCTINIDQNNIYIFTINKYNKKNNVIDIHIDKNNMTGYILNYNSYKKYSKNNILQLSIDILSIYHDIKIIYNIIINNNCFYQNNYIYNNEIKKLLNIFYFYTNIDIYIKYNNYIEPSLISESFCDKLNRLYIYKNNISQNIVEDNILYNIIINNKVYNDNLNNKKNLFSNEIIELFKKEKKDYIDKFKNNKNHFLENYFQKINNKILYEMKLFNKYNSILEDIKKHIYYLKNYDKNILNNFVKLNYHSIIDIQNINKLLNILNIFNINNFDIWIKFIKNKYFIWNKNIYNNIFFLNNNVNEKIICIELLLIICLYTNELSIFNINFFDINNIIFYSTIFSKNIFIF